MSDRTGVDGGIEIEVEVDVISPYAYLGWHAVRPIAAKHGCTVRPIPILFAALLNANGHKGPAEIPSKRVYTFKDCLRRADAFGLPLTVPPAHPFNPLLALRVASLDMDATTRDSLLSDLFRAVWVDGIGVTDPAVVSDIAARHGLDDAVVRASDPAIKARVRDATSRALERGTFGVPSFWVNGELFWGTDSLPFLDAYLGGHDPVPTDIQARWADLPAQSNR